MVRRLAIAATLGMFLVLLMGATVTQTGSAEGCGRSWPLCNGRFIPEFAVASLIEYGHRAVTGVVGLLIFALSWAVWSRWRANGEVRVLVGLMLGFLLLQSLMGAWAVLSPQSPPVLALHFGISLVAFASVFLTMTFVLEQEHDVAHRRDRPAPADFRRATWMATAYVLAVVYLGAYVQHTNSQLACLDWPLCNGALFPGFDGAVGVMFAHRLAALGSVALLGGLAAWAARFRDTRPDLFCGSLAAFALVVLQALSGGLVVLTRLSLWSTLSHAGIMALLFASLSFVCLRALPQPRAARASEAAPPPSTTT
jgi:cytochrome c oxidase assembly protein subunit 15